MTRVSRSRAALVTVLRDEKGAGAAWAVLWFLGCLALGGVAVDAANAFNMKSRLQSVADASALAAVMQIDDREAAREAAVTLAERNMPSARHGNVISAEDVRFGMLDAETGAFIEAADDEPADAVQLVAGRTAARGNAVPTYLLRLMGPASWEIGAAATARTSGRTAPPPPVDGPDCSAATILSTGGINAGGNNNFASGICIYAEEGIQVGGNNCFEDGAHIVSPDADLNRVNPLKCGEEEDVVVEATLEPKLLPEIEDGLFELIFDAVNRVNSKKWGDLQTPEQIALLPEHLIGARIQRVTANQVNFPDLFLVDHTIYLIDGDVQLLGGADISNAAFIVTGRLGISGGKNIEFDNIFFFSKGRLNFTGNAKLGDETKLCDEGRFRVYLFSEDNLSIGGGNSSTGVYGLMGAAPGFDPGGGLKDAKGLYIETEGYTTLGGGANLSGCDSPLASIYDDWFQQDPAGLGDDVAGATGTVLGGSLVE